MNKVDMALIVGLVVAVGIYLHSRNRPKAIAKSPTRVLTERLTEEAGFFDYASSWFDVINPFNESDAEARALLGLDKDEFGLLPDEDPFADPDFF